MQNGKEACRGQRPGQTNGATCRADATWLCCRRQSKPLACMWSESMRSTSSPRRGGLREQSEASMGTCPVDSLSRVTRLSRSHLTAKELDMECSTRFEMRGDIIEANLAAIFAQPKREFLPMRTPAHRKTRQQRMSEPLELLHVSGHVLKRRLGKT